MGVRKDLKRARRHSDLAVRAEVELVKDQHGTVREARTAPLVPRATAGSTADIPFTNAVEAPDTVVLRRKRGGRWYPVTAAAFAREVTETAKGLIADGLEPGGRVALMSRTRYEWAVLDFAIWAAGGQTVPIYATSSAEQIEWIVRDSGARFLIAETPENARTAEEALAAPRTPDGPALRIRTIDSGAMAELGALGRDLSDEEVTKRRSALTPDSIATLCYTSGTTGRPKGCVLTHGNLHAEAANTVDLLHPVFKEITGQVASTLLFLPLAHILGRSIQIACMMARIELGHCPSIKPDDLRPELRAFKPTFVVGVPYLFEKIHETGRATAEKIGRAASFDRAERTAVRFGEAYLSRFLDGSAPGPSLALRAGWALYELLVYRRIRKEVGGRLRYAISGGSPLDRNLNLFFYAAGIIIYEGYGLTETTAAATITPPLKPRPGTVGLPVPGTSIRIADDGEVLIKGGIVFGSYWNNPEATDAVLTDEWFATGDLGALDDEGYLTITGRKKDILVTSGGKNVSPAILEDRLRSRSPVGQCIVVGDNRSYVAALVTLDPEAVNHWLTVRKRPTDTPLAQLAHDPQMIAEVQRAVDYANEAVSKAESIRKFAIVGGEFTEDNGLLTPSLKIKRHAVTEAYAEEIEELYGG
ncbi:MULTISPECIES: AMP-dependent synthetase/ligase [Streptomyces]|uniref:Long-chain fatty acid--CoA ligase n=1 Tax=Streptomyces venezuelae TaxID=54571 RepID=A0A5P2BBM0_STRVZ|nr:MULTISPECIES: AMP-dependent synthetase/ligase [Streptomyces]NEA06498.1 AMP-binding protein [Streptomyces sp. SID10116]MYY84028.1 AMP-binding protein [Streptomyces sp. SID335]MYZ15880.1 AMP-binding protein [Streptomyces sp. SID337]NDZ87368.1 AMP-binding protein [Streptomyces sp. SID10115]NEB49635.1 AMP-binding protein [Streptomyces sp. SID339]